MTILFYIILALLWSWGWLIIMACRAADKSLRSDLPARSAGPPAQFPVRPKAESADRFRLMLWAIIRRSRREAREAPIGQARYANRPLSQSPPRASRLDPEIGRQIKAKIAARLMAGADGTRPAPVLNLQNQKQSVVLARLRSTMRAFLRIASAALNRVHANSAACPEIPSLSHGHGQEPKGNGRKGSKEKLSGKGESLSQKPLRECGIASPAPVQQKDTANPKSDYAPQSLIMVGATNLADSQRSAAPAPTESSITPLPPDGQRVLSDINPASRSRLAHLLSVRTGRPSQKPRLVPPAGLGDLLWIGGCVS